MEVDIYIFEIINSHLANDLFDQVLPWVRNKYTWIPLYIFLISFVLFNYGKKSIPFLCFLFLTVSMTDATSSHIIKKSIQRKRPCQEPANFDQITVRVNCGSGYSFTSSHAANHFSVAFFIFLFTPTQLKKWSYLLLIWAFMISFSQVYVGVHYPFDVLAGASLGICIASLMYFICRKTFYKA